MESDKGKLFIGGISWDTNEERLRDYFASYGEVVEAVIMKDRTTGRARGFGFVVFADPLVAERVVMEKHKIDGRVVEAKKAVPRDDLQALTRSAGTTPVGSPSPSRTKKIFVGGLASTVTEGDFRKYFEQYGTITDVVVMYDHSTQRPRGFGFITYDSEDAVDKVLLRTFHELNGKMVEVKRAIPKDLTAGPVMRSPAMGFTQGLNRMGSFLSGNSPGYNPGSASPYAFRIDTRFGMIPGQRNGNFQTFGGGSYGRTNLDQGPNLNYNENMNYSSLLSYGRGLSPYLSGNSTRFNNFMAYGSGSGGMESSLNSTMARNVWGSGVPNYNTNTSISSDFLRTAGARLGNFGSSGINWEGPATISGQSGRGSSVGYGTTLGLGFGSNENEYGLGGGGYGRSSTFGGGNLSYSSTNTPYEGAFSDLYGGIGDASFLPASSDLDVSSPFDYGIGNPSSDAAENGSSGYIGGYNNVIGRSNREN